jgi:hypothetical protein
MLQEIKFVSTHAANNVSPRALSGRTALARPVTAVEFVAATFRWAHLFHMGTPISRPASGMATPPLFAVGGHFPSRESCVVPPTVLTALPRYWGLPKILVPAQRNTV